jgi:transcriptional regulator with XRE-family HTH domain
MTFGEKLYTLRTAAELSQKALADAAGVAQTAIGHWETGERDPSWANVMKLCAALGVKCTEFADCAPGGAPDRKGPGRTPTPTEAGESSAKSKRKK